VNFQELREDVKTFGGQVVGFGGQAVEGDRVPGIDSKDGRSSSIEIAPMYRFGGSVQFVAGGHVFSPIL
jgi:hypothetical protein